ncbi:hypothetical protein FM119_01705 [Mycetocola reblochoni REB411]|uniref:Uncharacterized protein n=1 Tax=Mycetocola reblochoni REB411 TaxID=1255698 RepID=A0A1R4IGR9_9MICO|nr:hypothetical protein FM119_01705 [Mycetocola reblochoni REB411]
MTAEFLQATAMVTLGSGPRPPAHHGVASPLRRGLSAVAAWRGGA